MNVLLHDEPVTHKGTFEIRRTVTVHVTAQEAHRQVQRRLLLEVSHMMGADEPTLVVGNETGWRVPVHLSTPQRGVVGQIGYVDVDAVSGESIDLAPQKMLLEQQAHALMALQPPYKTKQLLEEGTFSYTVPRAPKITLDENDFPAVTQTN